MLTILTGGYNSRHPHPFCLKRPEGLDHYLLLLIKSPAVFHSPAGALTIQPGSAILVDRDTPYQYESTNVEYVNDWVHFSCEEEELVPIPFQMPIPLSNVPFLSLYFQQLMLEKRSTDEVFRTRNIHLLMQLLLNNVYLAARDVENRSFYSPYTARLQALRASLQSKCYLDYSAEKIAASLGISTSYFQHLYKDLFRISFHADLINMRIDYAKGLLLNTNLKLETIVEMCGYSNPVHFFRQFRKETGMTPGQFRNQIGSVF